VSIDHAELSTLRVVSTAYEVQIQMSMVI